MMNYAGLDKELHLERAGEFIVNARKKKATECILLPKKGSSYGREE